ncbi:MAG: ABC transporter ATP-binding protein/permease [Oscillospiraceae bacterium]|nr:ABC transporter ATP-binding protein/permease [Oscillospiraceae bacterium]
MLQLKNIVKQYGEGDTTVTALNGVSITFRENEFVAILGHSGCGKTTMLNIIGGLDHYTSGDLIINGVSTKDYKDRDWDAYRNHSIGFIFQSYNLIPHQTVLANVELALTISGVSKAERRKRAVEALEKVGLGNQLHKKPNQMSGGQMQRVAIARALINNPDILLADEPTGALDSETSIQVMELLKEIAKDKLVIMVTHNPELAEQYSNRIVRIKDGVLTDDSNPYTPEKEDVPAEAKKKRVSMSFFTAVSLSLNNLLTKKGRTILTAFAGSIGIIGIALILSLSTGINDYINGIQEDTLSSYPIDIYRETADTASLMNSMMESHNGSKDKDGGEENGQPAKVYSNTAVYEIFNAFNSSAKQTNDMTVVKSFLENDETVSENASSIAYCYDIQMPVFTKDPSGKIVKADFAEMSQNAMGMDVDSSSAMSSAMQMSPMGQVEIFEELLPGDTPDSVNEILESQYDLVYGSWPQSYDEAVVVLTRNNEIPDVIMYTLGFKNSDDLPKIMKAAMNGDMIEDYGVTEWSFEEICSKEYKLILPCEYYQRSETGSGYVDLTKTETGLDYIYSSDDIGLKLKITGFIRPSEDATAAMLTGYVGYTKALTDYVINKTNDSDIVKEQLENEAADVLSGLAFKTDDYVEPSDEEKAASAKEYISSLSVSEKADVFRFISSRPDEKDVDAYVEQYLSQVTREDLEKQIISSYSQEMGVEADSVSSYISGMDDETLFGYAGDAIREQYAQQYAAQVEQQLAAMTAEQLAMAMDTTEFTDSRYALVFDKYTPEEFSSSTYDDVLSALGKVDFDNPSEIKIYAKSFAEKDKISEKIAEYNDSADEDSKIHYTDYVALLMSSITDIISGISYLLIAFVAISLVVSSIMIGIITYISVLERTREIGILRAIGASKHDVSTVFNAETLLVGLTSGLIGVGVSYLAIIPINAIVYNLTQIEGLKAFLPPQAALILVAISMVLTLIAGLIPSRVASKKDPVEALRTE